MAPKDYGYIFEPAVDYQPRVVKEWVEVCNGKVIVDADGSVRLNPDSKTSGIDVLGHQITPKGYNSYEVNGWNFAAYKSAAFQLWKKRPKGLTWVEHIDRDRTNDSLLNLRPVNASLNNLNQYRPTTKGYVHETQEWVDKVNAVRRSGAAASDLAGATQEHVHFQRGVRGPTHQRRLQLATTRPRSVCASSGLSSCLPDDLALLVLELSGHVVIRSGGMAFHIFLRLS